MADFNLSAGGHFDRTGRFFLGGANIYFGTAAESCSALSPSWHVYGVSGGVNYNGIITGSAQLLLYPAGPNDPAPIMPGVVLPLNANGDAAALQTSSERLNGYFLSLPRSIEKASLEVVSQGIPPTSFDTVTPDSVATPNRIAAAQAFARPAGLRAVCRTARSKEYLT